MQALAVYGGTFDPIHNGHLHVADGINQLFHFSKTLFIPCKQPLLKANAQATSEQRIAMLKLAIANFASYAIDLREINRASKSFMVETLQSLRQQFPHDSLALIIGSDAFANLDKWHKWQDLLTYSHIIVVKRTTNLTFNAALREIIEPAITVNPQTIVTNKAGAVYLYDLAICDISSTQIRKLAHEKSNIKNLVPAAVEEYIKHHSIYQ